MCHCVPVSCTAGVWNSCRASSGIHLPLTPCRWRDSICADGAQNREQGYPHWFSLLQRYFIFVMFSMQFYVHANAILFVAEGIHNQPGVSGCYRDQEVHTMLLSGWTWQRSDVMAGRTIALCICKGMTWSGQRQAWRPLFRRFRLWQRAILVDTETQTVSLLVGLNCFSGWDPDQEAKVKYLSCTISAVTGKILYRQ